jgi:hypothetical protein
MNLPFQEKSIWRALIIIIVTYKYRCARLFSGGVVAAVFKSTVPPHLHRRGS